MSIESFIENAKANMDALIDEIRDCLIAASNESRDVLTEGNLQRLLSDLGNIMLRRAYNLPANKAPQVELSLRLRAPKE